MAKVPRINQGGFVDPSLKDMSFRRTHDVLYKYFQNKASFIMSK